MTNLMAQAAKRDDVDEALRRFCVIVPEHVSWTSMYLLTKQLRTYDPQHRVFTGSAVWHGIQRVFGERAKKNGCGEWNIRAVDPSWADKVEA